LLDLFENDLSYTNLFRKAFLAGFYSYVSLFGISFLFGFYSKDLILKKKVSLNYLNLFRKLFLVGFYLRESGWKLFL
jgi:hypothetical protein